MEFEVDSRFNGRPIPQISSLIVNQVSVQSVCFRNRSRYRVFAYPIRFGICDGPSSTVLF